MREPSPTRLFSFCVAEAKTSNCLTQENFDSNSLLDEGQGVEPVVLDACIKVRQQALQFVLRQGLGVGHAALPSQRKKEVPQAWRLASWPWALG